jgi:hypothetical protein
MERRGQAALPLLVLVDTAEQSGSPEEGELLPLDPGELASALRTLMEMKAASLVVQAPVLGISAGNTDSDETLRRFEEEFSLIGENVRTLFQAIRNGSVHPGDTERYVGELLALIDRGKERLVSGINREEFEQEIAGQAGILDRLWIAGAVYPRRNEERRNGPWYSRSVPDSDGRLRRIAPAIYAEGGEREHIAYAALKKYLKSPAVERNELGLVIKSESRGDLFVPLDAQGALLFEAPENGFIVLAMGELLEYGELDRELYRLLQEMRRAGYFDSLAPEKYPVFLYEFAQAAGEEFFTQDSAGQEEAWLRLREQYMESLAELFSGPVESSLVSGYEELIAQREIDERGRESLRALRDQLIASFAQARSHYETLSALRENLSETLAGSFCVLGPGGALFADHRITGGPENPTDSEASLILVNSILSGAAVTPAEDIELFFWALAPLVIAAFALRRRGIAAAAVLGLFLAVITCSAFSSALIFGGRWIDPLVPGAAVFAASLCSAMTALLIRNHGRRVIRRAYGPYVSKPALRQALKTGLPRPEEAGSAGALVLALRYNGILTPEAKASPLLAAERLRAYREEAGAFLKKAGAVLAGCDGDLVLAVFGSPLGMERKRKKGETQDPLDRALLAALECLRKADRDWRFGIDLGECAFSYAEIAGYSLLGPPAVSARLLSSLAGRYNARCLASCRVHSRIERAARFLKNAPELRRLDVMVERESGQEEEFFSLSFPG